MYTLILFVHPIHPQAMREQALRLLLSPPPADPSSYAAAARRPSRPVAAAAAVAAVADEAVNPRPSQVRDAFKSLAAQCAQADDETSRQRFEALCWAYEVRTERGGRHPSHKKR